MQPRRHEEFGSLEPDLLEERLRRLAERREGAGVVDRLELQHLVYVILHGALILRDLYASDKVGSLYTSDPRAAARRLLNPLVGEAERIEADRVARLRHLPDEIRLLGDKCLFDVGISRIQRFRGLDLYDLGMRAYRMASEILGILADDPHLRDFFEWNRISPLPISEEVTFLKQCAERFGIHADLLLHLQIGRSLPADSTPGIILPAPPPDRATEHGALPPAGVPASGEARQEPPAPIADPSCDFDGLRVSREDLLASYERILFFASLDVEELKRRLEEIVVDQPEAVDALCDEFALFGAGTHSLTKPPSYFFVGPTGVGKNYLVETVVRLLSEASGAEIPLLTIDGPNYTDASDINELRGSTRGFIRSDEEGVLSEFHERSSGSPLSVILVDEVEKAHPHLRKFFLSLMDRGTVTDNRGRSLFFSNAMLFFTSNLGYSEAAARAAPIGYKGDESRSGFERSEVDRNLRQALSAEFVNRLRIIRFRHLAPASIERIFDLEIGKVRKRFLELHGVELEVTSEARDAMIAQGYSHDYGARHLASVINRLANVEVAKRLKRDDAGGAKGERDVLDYLRQIRRKERAFDPREIRARVVGAARLRVGYKKLTIDYSGGAFVYTT